MPAIVANCCRCPPPFATSVAILVITREIAVPPASASMPTDANAFEIPSTCGTVKPAAAPAAEIRCAIASISCSVDAPKLPNATTAEPRFENWDCGIFITFASFAKEAPASSAVRFVAVLMSTIVFVKPRMSSLCTPN